MQYTNLVRLRTLAVIAMTVLLGSGCGYQSLEPGHRGLRFEPSTGLGHDVLQPGKHNLGWCFLKSCARIDDFDVTYSTRREDLKAASQEGLALEIRLSVIYRPIVAELYELDSEVGANYYDEVVGPEFRSAARGVFARHSYTDLSGKNEKVEDEIETEVRRRIRGKHVEVASITLETVGYAPEIVNAIRAKIVGEQESVRQKAALETQTAQAQIKIQSMAAEQEMNIKRQQSEATLQAQLSLANKKNERAIAEEDALLEKAKAEATIVHAKAEAQSITILAKAHAEENRAMTLAVSPLTVQMAAYEALGKLGGTNTTMMLGDFSHLPQFLFPPGMGLGTLGTYGLGGRMGAPPPK